MIQAKRRRVGSARNRIHLYIKPFLALSAILLAAAAMVYKDRIEVRAPAYVDDIAMICREAGEDLPLVLAVIQTESRFREDAVSPAGAVGLMQVMPDTGKWMADRLELEGHTEEKLRERKWNLTIGIAYIQYLKQRFPENLALALAAYNAGPSRVQGWMDTGKWDGSQAKLDDIPYKETRDYVKKVLKAYDSYKKEYP